MSSIGTGYDLAAATFSPDGRIFQVEYAAKAVDSSYTVIALASRHGVLTAVDLAMPSKLSFQDSNSRILDVNDKIGMVGTGLYPDLCSLCDYARTEANKYLKEFHRPVQVKKLANTVSEYVHILTLGISRPYGVSIFLTAWDDEKGPAIYCIEPSGQCHQMYSCVIGKNAQAAKTDIEKLEKEKRDAPPGQAQLDKAGLMKKAVRILLNVRDEGATGQKIEMGWTGDTSGGKFEKVDDAEIAHLEAEVKQEIENEEEA